ncbi:ABC transporter permease subunit [Arabiibacter massiliensis]|uniref:ABC transporter permease subunit n=1 Tax=Arabiibacter massiliensis TaxID=1870985 RepID=UPI001E494D66|nr:ABC transporter permease subunit [Arabiibacter massiliensis]
MLNYMKGEWYRIMRGKEVYLVAGILSLLAIAANALEFAMTFVDPDFPYATVRFNLGIVTSSLSSLFLIAGMLVWFLYAEDRKNGTLKNALSYGCSRAAVFAGRCIVSSLAGLVCLAVVLVAYVGSAVLLLEGPALPPVVDLLAGVAAALPSTLAAVALMAAVLAHCKSTSSALVVWVVVLFVIPYTLRMVGLLVEPVAAVAGWLPPNFFATEAVVSMSGSSLLWNEPAGLAKCLIAGFVGLAAFSAVGVWRARKIEL